MWNVPENRERERERAFTEFWVCVVKENKRRAVVGGGGGVLGGRDWSMVSQWRCDDDGWPLPSSSIFLLLLLLRLLLSIRLFFGHFFSHTHTHTHTTFTAASKEVTSFFFR